MFWKKNYKKIYEYVGEFKNNMMHGKGKYTHKANDNLKGYVHIGGYINNKKTWPWKGNMDKWTNVCWSILSGEPTYGTLRYSDGNRYEGEFKNGKRDGEGTYFLKKEQKKKVFGEKINLNMQKK